MVENINSKEAFDLLKEDEHSVLIDVRTKKEHLAVGIPDLREIGKVTYIIEWRNSISIVIARWAFQRYTKYIKAILSRPPETANAILS